MKGGGEPHHHHAACYPAWASMGAGDDALRPFLRSNLTGKLIVLKIGNDS
jgi:hypothetical protein